MKRLAIPAGLLLVAALATPVLGGNGAPSGPHYNLNVIGVANPKTATMDDTNRHTIFVPLTGGCQIKLTQGDFSVIDGNCFDGDAATFSLPSPDLDNDGVTTYSVFARALGIPGGSSKTTTCATDPSDGSLVCSVLTLELKRDTGKSTFQNVSKYLLYVYATIGGVQQRIPLFSSQLQNYFWQYDNQGLKLAQLRFYEGVCTMVPSATDPTGDQKIVSCVPD